MSFASPNSKRRASTSPRNPNTGGDPQRETPPGQSLDQQQQRHRRPRDERNRVVEISDRRPLHDHRPLHDRRSPGTTSPPPKQKPGHPWPATVARPTAAGSHTTVHQERHQEQHQRPQQPVRPIIGRLELDRPQLAPRLGPSFDPPLKPTSSLTKASSPSPIDKRQLLHGAATSAIAVAGSASSPRIVSMIRSSGTAPSCSAGSSGGSTNNPHCRKIRQIDHLVDQRPHVRRHLVRLVPGLGHHLADHGAVAITVLMPLRSGWSPSLIGIISTPARANPKWPIKRLEGPHVVFQGEQLPLHRFALLVRNPLIGRRPAQSGARLPSSSSSNCTGRASPSPRSRRLEHVGVVQPEGRHSTARCGRNRQSSIHSVAPSFTFSPLAPITFIDRAPCSRSIVNPARSRGASPARHPAPAASPPLHRRLGPGLVFLHLGHARRRGGISATMPKNTAPPTRASANREHQPAERP